jgi:hypothetical protein
VGVKQVKRHLDSIKTKTVSFRCPEHVQMNLGIFVAGKADEPDLAGFPRGYKSLHCAAFGKDAIDIVEPNHLVMLQKVDLIQAEPF